MNYKHYVLILSLLCGMPHAASAMKSSGFAYKLVSSLWQAKPNEADITQANDLLIACNYNDACKIINNYSGANLRSFAASLTQHAVAINNSGASGTQLLLKAIKGLPQDDAMPLVESLAKGVKNISLSLLIAISDIPNYTKYIDGVIVDLVNNGDGADLMKGLSYVSYKGKTNLPFKLTPTGLHLYKNLWSLDRYPVDKYKADPRLMDVLSSIIAKEKELDAKGFYTFLHGQRRVYYFPESIYTMLWQIRKNYICNNFIFAHVKPLLITEKEIADEQTIREYLLEFGRKPKDNHTRQKLLFLNYAHFAQMNDMGSNTAHYVANNRNLGSVPINIFPKDAFKILGFEHMYEKYSTEIEGLQREYENSGQFGNTLIVAIPKDKVHQYAFLCESGKGLSGRGGVRKSVHINGIGYTDDIKIIMETLLNHPEKMQETDDLEFCLIMTQSEGGLDPQTGIQIHPLISGDKAKIAQLKAKERALFQTIENDIKAELAVQQSQNRALHIGGHLIAELKNNALNAVQAAGRAQNILRHLKV